MLKKSDCHAYSRHVDRNTSLGECKGCPPLLNVLEGGKRGLAISLRRMYAVTADPSEDLCRHLTCAVPRMSPTVALMEATATVIGLLSTVVSSYAFLLQFSKGTVREK